MPVRTIDVHGTTWEVQPSGFVTQYDADEYGIVFVRHAGGERELRVTRYRPEGSRGRDQSLAECSDATLRELFARYQPSATSPEGGYAQ